LIRVTPEAGGEYVFLARNAGPVWGFLAGWVSLIAGFTGAIAIAATTFEIYALPSSVRPGWLPDDMLACAAIGVFGRVPHCRI
jgi:APA family basic amino acid/polyamine antiporter